MRPVNSCNSPTLDWFKKYLRRTDGHYSSNDVSLAYYPISFISAPFTRGCVVNVSTEACKAISTKTESSITCLLRSVSDLQRTLLLTPSGKASLDLSSPFRCRLIKIAAKCQAHSNASHKGGRRGGVHSPNDESGFLTNSHTARLRT